MGINLPAMGIRPIHDVDEAILIEGLNARGTWIVGVGLM